MRKTSSIVLLALLLGCSTPQPRPLSTMTRGETKTVTLDTTLQLVNTDTHEMKVYLDDRFLISVAPKTFITIPVEPGTYVMRLAYE